MNQIEKDYRAVLSHYLMEDLLRLEDAFASDRVVRGKYTDFHGKGCLMWHLANGTICNRIELTKAFPGASYAAPRDIVRAFDDGRLTMTEARRILELVIVERQIINAAEERAIAKTVAQASRL
jgi:hypothetical protein